jgi:hypothetical protein
MQVPESLQRYFQQIRPLCACDAEDGRIVGRMLVDMVESKSKEAHGLVFAIRAFVNRTAMLRESGFRHIGGMLAHLLTADAQSGAVDETVIVALDPSSVTEKQAAAIGNAIASRIRRSHVPATALKNVVQSHAVLHAMKLAHVWFLPMLEVLTARKVAGSRPATFLKQVSGRAGAPRVASNVLMNEDRANEEASFSSVVTARPPVIVCVLAGELLMTRNLVKLPMMPC